MPERLRALLERPLSPAVARAVLATAAAGFSGLALLLFAGAVGGDLEREPSPSAPPARGGELLPLEAGATPSADGRPADLRSLPRQDPQDRAGSPAARRAARALESRRALQHVPYRRGRLRIELVGARGMRAVLRVSAPTVRAARRGWRRFLHRHRDTGHAYIPVFSAARGERSRGGA